MIVGRKAREVAGCAAAVGGDEAPGRSRLGIREDLAHLTLLHDHAAVQNGDGVADLFHDAHLVGDDHHGDAQLLVDVLNASARAMAMRCFWPPESWAG